jgi:putative transposase
MSNHIHLICYTKEPFALSEVIRDFKKFTSKAIIDRIIESSAESRKAWILDLLKKFGTENSRNKTFQLWQNDNKPIELVTKKWTMQKLAYIHLNPVRIGIVAEAEHYVFSSAGAYIGNEGLIELELLDI